jgi:hypothetical protein
VEDVGDCSGWGYTDGLGNLDVYVIGTTDSLTGDVMLMVMLIVVVVVVVLLSAWIGGYELLEDGDNRAMMISKSKI